MTKEAILEEIKTGKKEIEQLKEVLKEKVGKNFHKLTTTIFDEYPEVKNFGWRQYTPYFNDGEECVFDANTSDFFINGFDEYGDEAWGYNDEVIEEDNLWGENYNHRKEVYGNGGKVPNPNYDPRIGAIYEAISELLNVFDDEDYRGMYGDHTIVVVTPKGVETSSFEHD